MNLLPKLSSLGEERFQEEEIRSSLDFLRAIYRNPSQPMQQRMRAAIAALPFEHPKLAVTATIDGEGFAAKLEGMLVRSRKTISMIHAPIDADNSQQAQSELLTNMAIAHRVTG